MAEQHKLLYPLGYGVDAKDFARATGAFFDDKKGFLHATGFIIRPNGTVENAVYSTGPIGRFVAAESLGLIGYRMK